VIDRRRIELVDDGEVWAKQPYHTAEDLEKPEAIRVVKSGIQMAHRVAAQRVREAVKRMAQLKNDIAGCAVLVPDPMPDWTTHEILAVHMRMHKAEGVLFPDALCRAVEKANLPLAAVPEKRLEEYAERILRKSFARTVETIIALGKSVGPPWGKDQKNAALAAMIGLHSDFQTVRLNAKS
jgi:hypothetical protein